MRAIDHGTLTDGRPFLVLEYLIGADLKQYSKAKLMSLFELRQVVLVPTLGWLVVLAARKAPPVALTAATAVVWVAVVGLRMAAI